MRRIFDAVHPRLFRPDPVSVVLELQIDAGHIVVARHLPAFPAEIGVPDDGRIPHRVVCNRRTADRRQKIAL